VIYSYGGAIYTKCLAVPYEVPSRKEVMQVWRKMVISEIKTLTPLALQC
jgi:hypothetical protein